MNTMIETGTTGCGRCDVALATHGILCAEHELELRRGEGYVQTRVASCLICGGKYRPAGGECIHEHPAWDMQTVIADGKLPYDPRPFVRDGYPREGYYWECGQCHEEWTPGHTCIRQPTPKQVQELAEMAYFLRLLDEVLEHFGYETVKEEPAEGEGR